MYIDSIKKRHSVRTFTGETFSNDIFNQINFILKENVLTPYNTHCRFKLLRNEENSEDVLKGLGTYGTIKNPSGFVVGLLNKKTGNLIDYGYSFEKLILQLTNLGINTCWLGGTFSKSSFFKKADGQSDELIPCVVALGYEAEKISFTDKLIRKMAKSHKRKDWKDIFFKEDFNCPITDIDKPYKIPLEMLRLSPSASNKQPWQILVQKGEFQFFLKRNESYHKMINFLKLSDLQMIDMGICMSHFELSMREQSINGKWDIPGTQDNKFLVGRFKINGNVF